MIIVSHFKGSHVVTEWLKHLDAAIKNALHLVRWKLRAYMLELITLQDTDRGVDASALCAYHNRIVVMTLCTVPQLTNMLHSRSISLPWATAGE